MRVNSLAFRLFATAAVWTLLVLPIAGFIILSLYRQEAESNFNDRIRTLLTVIQADSIDHQGSEPGAPKDVGEPLFEITHSGWYWQIRPVEGTPGRRLVSTSLASETLASPADAKIPLGPDGFHWMDRVGPAGHRVRIAERIDTIGEDINGPRYSYMVAGPLNWPEARIAAFRTRLIFALAIAGIGLLGVTLFQVHFGLHPLRQIEQGLSDIRSGQAHSLGGELPAEIEPLQRELNALITSNQEIIDRARTQVGNLAHALKTPLAVITNEARDDKSPFASKVASQAQLMNSQISHYLERARIAASAATIGRVTEVRPVIEGLQRALERIYRDKGVRLQVSCPDGARFQGEKQDLEEMLGNLLDNACKWAKNAVHAEVRIVDPKARTGVRRLAIAVEDNGPGLTADQRAKLGKRGLRLDESKPGTGLGLSIVADLAQSYRGSFKLEASRHGGLACLLDLPAA